MNLSKLDYLPGLVMHAAVALLVALFVWAVIHEALTPAYPPAPAYGPDQSAPIGGGYGNSSNP